MSKKTIDEKIVEMKFDNSNFEKNVKTTMTTLEKFKKKLDFKNHTKSLNNLEKTISKFDMNGMSKAIDTVHAKFSALDVIGMTTISNLTNNVLNASKKIVSALTIDPIKTGFEEYETQLNSVQTILANTESKGSTLKDVNKALDELNEYADLTIYNFTEMTRNIGTFTAAGIDLKTSVSAIKGIANLAAVSGSTSQQASNAMYQLSQALASGTVKLMDWNSVVNSGMGGQVFQDALKETAKVHNIDVDAMIKKEGSFRETLQKGWLSSDILTETLHKFTMAAEEGTEKYEEYKKSLKEKGYTEEQAKEILKLGTTATNAATKVRTFSQLWSVLQEAAQSGWSKSWNLIVGDFEEATNLLSPLSNALTNIIEKISDARNHLLESALGKSFSSALDVFKNATQTVEKTAEGVKTITKAVKDYNSVVDQIINGSWGNGEIRFNKLTEAGYNYAHAQNMVNKELGNGFRYTDNYDEVQNKNIETTKKSIDTNKQNIKTKENDIKTTKEIIKTAMLMSDEELRSNKMTEEQIKTLHDLKDIINKTGIPMEEFIDNMDKINGRWLIFEGLGKIGNSIVRIIGAIGTAFKNIFPITGDGLFNIIAGFHKLSRSLVISDENINNIRRTVEGFLSVVKLGLKVVLTPLGFVLKIIFNIIKNMISPILSITAIIGDVLKSITKFIDKLFNFSYLSSKVSEGIKFLSKAFTSFINRIKDSEAMKKFTEKINKMNESIERLHKKFRESEAFKNFIKLIDNIKNKFKEWFNIIAESDTIKNFNKWIDNSKNAIKKWIDEFDIDKVFHNFINYLNTAINSIQKFGKQIVESEGWKNFIKLIDNIKNKFKEWFNIISNSNAIKEFNKWIDNSKNAIKKWINEFDINDVFRNFVHYLDIAIDAICKWNKQIAESEGWKKFVGVFINIKDAIVSLVKNIANSKSIKAISNFFSNIGNSIGSWFEGLSKAENIGKYIFDGLLNGIKNGAANVIKFFIDFGTNIIDAVKKVFGIHSPSKVFFLIGTYIILGLSRGIGDHISIVYNMITSIGQKILDIVRGMNLGKLASTIVNKFIDMFKNIDIDLGSFLTTLVTSTILWGFVKVVKFLDHIAKPLDSITGMFNTLTGAVNDLKNTITKKFKVDAFRSIALSIAIIAGSIAALALLDTKKVLIAAGLITALMMIMGGLIILTGKFGDKLSLLPSNTDSMKTLFKMLLMLSAAVLLMSHSVKNLSAIDDWKKLLMGLGSVLVLMYGLIKSLQMLGKITDSKNEKQIKEMRKTFLSLSLSIAAMTHSVKYLGELDPAKLWQGIKAISILSGIIVAILFLGKVSEHVGKGKMLSDISGTLKAISFMFLAMTATVAIMGKMDVGKIRQGMACVFIFSLFIVGLIASIGFLSSGKEIQNIGDAIIKIGATIGIMAVVVKMLGGMKISSITKGVIAVAALGGIAVGLIKLTQGAKGSDEALDAAKSLLHVAIAIGALGVAVVLLGMVDKTALIKGTIVVGILGLIMSLIIHQVGKVQKVTGTIAALTILMGVLVGGIALLSMIKPEKALPAAFGLGLVIGALSLVLNQLSKFKINEVGKISALMIVLSITISAIGGIIYLLSSVPWENALASAGALGIVMTTLIVALAVIGKVKFDVGKMIIGIVGLGVILAGIYGVMKILKQMEGIQNAQKNAIILGAFMGVLLITLLATVGVGALYMATGGIAATGLIGLAGILLAVEVIVLILMQMEGIQNAEQNVNLLCKLLTVMTIALIALGLIGPLALIGVAAAGALLGVITAFGTLATAVGALMEKFPQLEDFLNKGIPVLIKISNGIGQMVGAFIDGALVQAVSSLPEIGQKIGEFVNNMGDITPEKMEGVKTLAEALMILTGANLLDNIMKWFGKSDTITEFANQLPILGKGMANFNKELGEYGDKQIASTNAACETIKAIAQLGNVDTNNFEKNIGNFGGKLSELGNKFSEFVDKMVNVNSENIEIAKNRILQIIELFKSITPESLNSITKFNDTLTKLGSDSINAFHDAFTDEKIKGKIIVYIIDIMDNISSKISENIEKCKNQAKLCMDGIAGIFAAESYKTGSTKAGSNFVQGFINGMTGMSLLVSQTSYRIGSKAVESLNKGIEARSPSKATTKSGKFFGQGFINGIRLFTEKAYNAGQNMASEAKGGLSNAISNISDIVYSDVDNQPVITPVLDLSNIESGSSRLSSMLNSNSELNIASNINSNVERMNQNKSGTNIISAINKLRKDVSDMNNNTYNINGITYDDGSNINNAVETLVRAAKIERRR